MNSTRTWVTPPRDPIWDEVESASFRRIAARHCVVFGIAGHTCSAEDSSDFDELDWDFACVHIDVVVGKDSVRATVSG